MVMYAPIPHPYLSSNLAFPQPAPNFPTGAASFLGVMSPLTGTSSPLFIEHIMDMFMAHEG